MTEWSHAWLHAYLLTQMIEVPLYFREGRHLPDNRSFAAAVGASSVTHPVLWLCFPWDAEHYTMSIIAGESFVVLMEAAILRMAGFRRALLVSLAVNAVSCGAGILLQWMGMG